MAHASTAAAEDSCPLLLGENKLPRHREADTSEGWVTFLHVFLYFWRHDGARQHSGSRRFLSAVARKKQAAATPWGRHVGGTGNISSCFSVRSKPWVIPLHDSCLSNPVSTLMVGTCPLDERISVVLSWWIHLYVQYVVIMMIWLSSYEWCVDAWFLVMRMSIFT